MRGSFHHVFFNKWGLQGGRGFSPQTEDDGFPHLHGPTHVQKHKKTEQEDQGEQEAQRNPPRAVEVYASFLSPSVSAVPVDLQQVVCLHWVVRRSSRPLKGQQPGAKVQAAKGVRCKRGRHGVKAGMLSEKCKCEQGRVAQVSEQESGSGEKGNDQKAVGQELHGRFPILLSLFLSLSLRTK